MGPSEVLEVGESCCDEAGRSVLVSRLNTPMWWYHLSPAYQGDPGRVQSGNWADIFWAKLPQILDFLARSRGYLLMTIWCKVEWWQTDLSWNVTGSNFPRPQWHEVQWWSSLFAFLTQLSSVVINWWDCPDYRHRWNHQPIEDKQAPYTFIHLSTSWPLNRALTHETLRLQGLSPHESSVDFAKTNGQEYSAMSVVAEPKASKAGQWSLILVMNVNE